MLLSKASYGNSNGVDGDYNDMETPSIIDISVKKIPRWNDDEVRRYIV